MEELDFSHQLERGQYEDAFALVLGEEETEAIEAEATQIWILTEEEK